MPIDPWITYDPMFCLRTLPQPELSAEESAAAADKAEQLAPPGTFITQELEFRGLPFPGLPIPLTKEEQESELMRLYGDSIVG